jgi:hypothetical protein
MKTKNIYLFLSLFTIIFFACDPETKEEKVDALIEDANNAGNKSVYKDIFKYNDAIVGLDTKITIEILKFEPLEDVDEMRKQLSVIQKEISSATDIIQKISCPKDKNNKFKKATISMFEKYNKLYVESWSSFLDEMDNENIDNMLDYNENIRETLNDKLYNVIESEEEVYTFGNSWLSAQESFAKENGSFVDPEDHPLDEEFDNL